RLFPDIYPDRPEDAAEFRRYTEGDLKTGKIDQAGAILAALPSAGAGGAPRPPGPGWGRSTTPGSPWAPGWTSRPTPISARSWTTRRCTIPRPAASSRSPG